MLDDGRNGGVGLLEINVCVLDNGDNGWVCLLELTL